MKNFLVYIEIGQCHSVALALQEKQFNFFFFNFCWVVGLSSGAGQLPVPGRLATFEYSRARACCACSRCGTGGLYFLSIFHF